MRGSPMRIAVLVACYDRFPVTIASIGSLKRALEGLRDVEAAFFVVDDASPDGTGDRLRQAFPDMVVGRGTGALYWVGGMCRAYDLARESGGYDAYLLFNDDVLVDAQALARFVAEYREINARGPAILAAATRSAVDGSITYSAMRRLSKLRPLAVEKIIPDGSLQPCDTFHGNFVLVPGSFFEEVGGLDSHFVQSYADVDLGYVAEAEGVPRYLASVPVGTCEAAEAAVKLPGPLSRFSYEGLKKDSLSQRAYFTHKHLPSVVAAPLILGAAIRWMLRSAAAILMRPSARDRRLVERPEADGRPSD